MAWSGAGTWGYDKGLSASFFLCLDEKTGKELYRYVSPRIKEEPHIQDPGWHSMGNSPLFEGDRMWFTTNCCEVVCLDIGLLRKRQGKPKQVWKVDMRKELGVFPDGRCMKAGIAPWLLIRSGYTSSPATACGKGRALAAPNAPSLVCFDKNTGKVVWKDNLPGKDILHSQFASPTVIEVNGRTQVVAPQGDGWLRFFRTACAFCSRGSF